MIGTSELTDDPWLGGVLGRPCYKYCIENGAEKPSVIDALPTGSFVYAKVNVSEIGVCSRLEDVGFKLVDTNLVFSGRFSGSDSSACDIRFARPADLDAVVQLAWTSFRYSRFHLDSLFSDSDANKVKAEWAGNFFRGARGDWMVVATGDDGNVQGFLQLMKANSNILVIDLITVGENFREHGVARAMICYALNACGSFETLRVGTQAANIPSVRFYEGLRLRLSNAQYVFHWHSPSGA